MGARRPQILSGVDEGTGGSNSADEIGDGERIRWWNLGFRRRIRRRYSWVFVAGKETTAES
jgi:hypothetical protein